jgi:hypothetical protein
VERYSVVLAAAIRVVLDLYVDTSGSEVSWLVNWSRFSLYNGNSKEQGEKVLHCGKCTSFVGVGDWEIDKELRICIERMMSFSMWSFTVFYSEIPPAVI